MKTFQPLPADEPLMTIPEFLLRLKHDPGFADKMQAHYQAMLAQPLNDDTAAMHKGASAAYRTFKHHQGVWKATQALVKSDALLEEQGGDWDAATLRRIGQLADDAVDHLLDALEPERTRLIARATGIQAMVREMLAKW